MKVSVMNTLCRWLVVTVIFFLAVRCTTRDQVVGERIREYTDRVKVINTHEHQRWSEKQGDRRFRFYHLVIASYLNADLKSAGGGRYDRKQLDSLPLDELWNKFGQSLDDCRNTSYYGHYMKGLRKLYGIDDLFFTKENIETLSARIEKNYSDYRSWFDEAFQKAGFELMFLDHYWNVFDTDTDTLHYALVFRVNDLIVQARLRPEPGDELISIYKEADREGYTIQSLDDYLEYCDHLFRKNIEQKAVCIKNALAYSRTLFYEAVPYEDARILFGKKASSLTPEEAKKLEDFMFHWIIQKAIDYNLPVQIHTGYLAGNSNTLDNSNPVRLNNLFLNYPQAKFVLFHGGFPWTGECAALAKMFPNVYLDLVWLPQISREEAVHALDVMLDCVPHNKFFWGGDCHTIEESTGSLIYGKEVVAEVLANRVARGLMTEELALKIVDRIFRENAIEVFRLEEKLGREF